MSDHEVNSGGASKSIGSSLLRIESVFFSDEPTDEEDAEVVNLPFALVVEEECESGVALLLYND